MRRTLIYGLALVFPILVFLSSNSKAPATEAGQEVGNGYVGVAEICQACHKKEFNQLSKTAMGVVFLKHPRNAKEQLGCETCHGPSAEHVSTKGKSFVGMTLFTKAAPTPVSERNAVCLGCHQKRERLFWSGGVHENNGLACTSCHTVHGPGAAVPNQLARLTVEDTCAPCHKVQARAELRFSHHPLREGKMNCASCHNPHGTVSPHLVRGLSNRELCLKCHAQYRGPFIFQHPPVMEDCFNCHQPHGSPYLDLLKTPPIRLCRECHTAFHNLPFQSTGGAPGIGPVRPTMIGGGACLNCHKMIHGSNNMNGNLFFH